MFRLFHVLQGPGWDFVLFPCMSEIEQRIRSIAMCPRHGYQPDDKPKVATPAWAQQIVQWTCAVQMCNEKLQLQFFCLQLQLLHCTFSNVHFYMCFWYLKNCNCSFSKNCSCKNKNCSCSFSLPKRMFQPAGALSVVICPLRTPYKKNASTYWNGQRPSTPSYHIPFCPGSPKSI